VSVTKRNNNENESKILGGSGTDCSVSYWYRENREIRLFLYFNKWPFWSFITLM